MIKRKLSMVVKTGKNLIHKLKNMIRKCNEFVMQSIQRNWFKYVCKMYDYQYGLIKFSIWNYNRNVPSTVHHRSRCIYISLFLNYSFYRILDRAVKIIYNGFLLHSLRCSCNFRSRRAWLRQLYWNAFLCLNAIPHHPTVHTLGDK